LTPWFIATQKFDRADAPWGKYIAWSHLKHLEEVVSLDPSLCPTLIPEIKPDYWSRIVNEDFTLDFFTDPDYLRELVAGIPQKNFLCIFRNPSVPPDAAVPLEFEFLG